MGQGSYDSWKAKLRSSAIEKIAELQTEGTVAMHFDNFAMVVRIPPGGPVGTNAQWSYRTTLREIVRDLPSSFVYFEKQKGN